MSSLVDGGTKSKIATLIDAGSARNFGDLIEQGELVGEASSDELMHSRSLGMPTYMLTQARKVPQLDGSPELMLVVLADITALKPRGKTSLRC